MKVHFNINRLYLLLVYTALAFLLLSLLSPSAGMPLLAGALLAFPVLVVFSYEPLLRTIEQATGNFARIDELAYFSAFVDLNRKMHTFLQADDVLILVNDTLKDKIRLRKTLFLLHRDFARPEGLRRKASEEADEDEAFPLRIWPDSDRAYDFMSEEFVREVLAVGTVFSRQDASPVLRRAFEESDASLAIPIIQNRRLLCLIMAGRLDNRRPYSEFEYQMFNFLANQLSIVLDRIRIYEQVMQKTAMDHAEKMQVMQSLSANIAHEMRTPLSGIRASITGIETYLPDLIEAYDYAMGEAPERFRAIRDSHLATLRVTPERITLMIDQANAVIDMLLMNLRENSLDRRQLRLCETAACIEQAVDRYPFKTGERDKVSLDLQDDFRFQGLETLFIYIIFNLLKNALYSIRSAQKGGISICLRRDGDYNYVLFRDTGVGIQPDIRERIFEGFFTTKADGTGAGLAFCRRTVLSFGGDIECVSEPGEFAEFRISLPAVGR